MNQITYVSSLALVRPLNVVAGADGTLAGSDDCYDDGGGSDEADHHSGHDDSRVSRDTYRTAPPRSE